MNQIIFSFLFLIAGLLNSPLPQARHLEEITFDIHRNKLILYGGAVAEEGKLKEFTQVHEWDGAGWKEFNVAGPGGRSGHALIYHEADKVTYLIGGVTEAKSPYIIYLDVWQWNGKDWKLVNSDCPFKIPEAVYDPVNKHILAYGDASDKTKFTYGTDQKFELWEYTSNTWKKLSANGPQTDGPTGIAYDTNRQTLVIPNWEAGKAVIWEWKDNAWKKITCNGNCPPARNRFPLVYYPEEKATYLFGGFTEDRKQLGDFWKWDGIQWIKLETATAPSVRNSTHFAYGQKSLLLYGGSVPKPGSPGQITLCSELWQWKAGAWKQIQ
jgi:hypothetical protein